MAKQQKSQGMARNSYVSKGEVCLKTMKVRLTFTEPLLGMSPANEQIYRDYIGSKAPDASKVEDEVAALGVEAVVEKAMTVFPRLEDGTPFLWDYQMKGFFKGVCSYLWKVSGTESNKIKAYKKAIDGLIFVTPRRSPFRSPDGKPLEVGKCERPLRAQTPQGDRVALACSEEIPAGAQIELEILMMDDKAHEKAVREWLDYGVWSGIGQWRNSGKGRFTWEEIG